MASETFVNDASTGTVNYPNGGTGTANSVQSTVSIVYNAATGSYTISNAGRSQTFAPTDINAQSTSSLTVYARQNGSTTDTLSLTNPASSNPANLRYTYVGGAVWQRTINGTSGVSGSFDSVSYGVRTPDADVPRTGSARYTVELLGATASPVGVSALGGTGNLLADFATGRISASGSAREVDSVTGQPTGSGDWALAATLGSSNALSGTFTLYQTSPYRLSGPFNGRFYGPSVAEVGGAYSINGTGPNGATSVSGVLLGAIMPGSGVGLNGNLLDLKADQSFFVTANQFRYSVNSTTGLPVNFFTDFNSSQSFHTLDYRASDRSYTVNFSGVTTSTFTPAQIVASESNARYTVYSKTSGTTTDRLVLYKPGPGNGELALTYTSFANFIRTQTGVGAGGTQTSIINDWGAFGNTTAGTAVPASGTGNYNGVLYGTAVTDGAKPLTLDGSAQFAMNFATRIFTGNMHPFASDGTSRVDLGQIDFLNGRIQSGAGFTQGAFTADFAGQGLLYGQFTGPNAEEIGAYFAGRFVPPGTNSFSGYLQGAIVGKKAP